MGRGLSELQKTILQLALEKRFKDGAPDRDRGYRDDDVDHADVLEVHFGWERWGGPWPGRMFEFSPDEIGRQKYNAGMSALSRALARLESRGLLENWYNGAGRPSGYFLTDAGIALAKGLSVKSASRDADLTDSKSIADPDNAE